jgi:hypothetical protein
MSEVQFPYWDVLPKSIKIAHGSRNMRVPLSIRGKPRGRVCFDVSNMAVATVDDAGVVSLGFYTGAAVISVYDSEDRTSVRYVQLEVVPVTPGIVQDA